MSATWPLRPRAARVFYNLVDACAPESGERDPVAALAGTLGSPRARRAAERDLWLLEWSPRLLLADTCGFSWLSRARRRAWLERLATSRVAWIRSRASALRALVAAGDARDQSRDGP